VTNLGNGRSVIVKINDRGPYTRGRILDLSPRAADALDMKRAGVAAIVLEPLVNQAAPTAAVFQTSDTSMEEMPISRSTTHGTPSFLTLRSDGLSAGSVARRRHGADLPG
jgi:rare lipoprotein A